MTSAKSYARAYLDATSSLEATERVAWLMAVRERAAQRALVRILQQPDSVAVLKALSVPESIARFFVVLHEDGMIDRLGVIAEQGLVLAARQGIALPVQLTTADTAGDLATDVHDALSEVSSLPVVLETRADPRVLGGYRIEVGENRIDRTLAARLASLRRTLIGTQG